MYLIAGVWGVGQLGKDRLAQIPGDAADLGAGLLCAEGGDRREQTHPLDAAAVFDAQRVIELFSQHLIAAADAKDRRSLRSQLEDGSLQTALAHPQQVLHGIFGAGQHHHVRLFEFGCTFDIAHRYPVHTFQTVQVGEIGDARQANDRDVQHGRCGAAGEAFV